MAGPGAGGGGGAEDYFKGDGWAGPEDYFKGDGWAWGWGGEGLKTTLKGMAGPRNGEDCFEGNPSSFAPKAWK